MLLYETLFLIVLLLHVVTRFCTKMIPRICLGRHQLTMTDARFSKERTLTNWTKWSRFINKSLTCPTESTSRICEYFVSVDTFTLHLDLDIRTMSYLKIPTGVKRSYLHQHLPCHSVIFFVRAGERSYDGFAGDLTWKKHKKIFFAAKIWREYYRRHFGNKALRNIKSDANTKRVVLTETNWGRWRQLLDVTCIRMKHCMGVYVYMCTFHNYIFLKFLHLPRSCLKCKGWHDLCAINTSHTVQKNRDAVCMSEIEWMDAWMQAGMRQWVDQWMKNLMNKAREKSESNRIEWINGMTLQDMEWIIMNVQ